MIKGFVVAQQKNTRVYPKVANNGSVVGLNFEGANNSFIVALTFEEANNGSIVGLNFEGNVVVAP